MPRPTDLRDLAHLDLPVLESIDARGETLLARYRQFSAHLASSGLQIVGLYADRGRSYTVYLKDAPRLILGRHSHGARLDRFLAAYGSDFVRRGEQIAYVDLRYPDGFAVRWKEAELS